MQSLLLILMSAAGLLAGEYFEGFDAAGEPPTRQGISWGYTDELAPVEGWKSIIPGDGYAHLRVVAKSLGPLPLNNTQWPFQTLSLGPIGRNHRISIRAKNTAIQGVACMLFTYRETGKVDEIDIEIVAHDTAISQTSHKTGTNGGWTDVRLNTWAGATGTTLHPSRSIRTPILDARGKRVSHQDGEFHIYTIEWRSASVHFYIDGILQGVIRDIVPDSPSRVIFGIRRMPWAGTREWKGSQTLLVDWIDIEPLERFK